MSLANCLIEVPEAPERAGPEEQVTVIRTDLPEDH